MHINEGGYYVIESSSEAQNEMYILRVLPRMEWAPQNMIPAETLAVHADMCMWNDQWIDSYFTREALQKEIDLFESEREKNRQRLVSYGELVSDS